MGALPQRSRPAHHPPVRRENQPIVLFVTVCVRERRQLLDNHDALDAIQSAWEQCGQWRVGEFLLMPDHAHLFCTPGVMHPESIRSWIQYWKRVLGDLSPPMRRIWQRGGWDTQMRDHEHYLEKIHYMRMNPVRAELVEEPEAWPYRGCLTRIRW